MEAGARWTGKGWAARALPAPGRAGFRILNRAIQGPLEWDEARWDANRRDRVARGTSSRTRVVSTCATRTRARWTDTDKGTIPKAGGSGRQGRHRAPGPTWSYLASGQRVQDKGFHGSDGTDPVARHRAQAWATRSRGWGEVRAAVPGEDEPVTRLPKHAFLLYGPNTQWRGPVPGDIHDRRRGRPGHVITRRSIDAPRGSATPRGIEAGARAVGGVRPRALTRARWPAPLAQRCTENVSGRATATTQTSGPGWSRYAPNRADRAAGYATEPPPAPAATSG